MHLGKCFSHAASPFFTIAGFKRQFTLSSSFCSECTLQLTVVGSWHVTKRYLDESCHRKCAKRKDIYQCAGLFQVRRNCETEVITYTDLFMLQMLDQLEWNWGCWLSSKNSMTIANLAPMCSACSVLFHQYYFSLCISTCSVCLECPQRSGTDLREDITTLIKFWQAIFQDKKSLLAILNVESKQRSASMSSDIAIYSVSLVKQCLRIEVDIKHWNKHGLLNFNFD